MAGITALGGSGGFSLYKSESTKTENTGISGEVTLVKFESVHVTNACPCPSPMPSPCRKSCHKPTVL